MLGNGQVSPPTLLGQITIAVTSDGQLGVNVVGNLDQLGLFAAIGQAQALLAQKCKEQVAQQIQVAPAGLVNRLIQG